jgi:hypothetical protein
VLDRPPVEVVVEGPDVDVLELDGLESDGLEQPATTSPIVAKIATAKNFFICRTPLQTDLSAGLTPCCQRALIGIGEQISHVHPWALISCMATCSWARALSGRGRTRRHCRAATRMGRGPFGPVATRASSSPEGESVNVPVPHGHTTMSAQRPRLSRPFKASRAKVMLTIPMPTSDATPSSNTRVCHPVAMRARSAFNRYVTGL